MAEKHTNRKGNGSHTGQPKFSLEQPSSDAHLNKVGPKLMHHFQAHNDSFNISAHEGHRSGVIQSSEADFGRFAIYCSHE